MDVDLALAHVSKRFDGTTAVDDVSLEVRNGEFLSFLGPSGCGKTTTLRLIAGFEQPDEGDIRLKGRSVAGTPPNKRDVNTVFQHYALFPHLAVFDNIAYPLAIRKQPAQTIASRVQEMLGVVDLAGLDRRYPHQISGGQQQRVALARALINRPAVLLLDEPLGALDLMVRKRMQVELKRIQRSLGITFIYVTHDQEEALTLSDRIAVMNKGKIEQIGTPDEVYNHPATRFVLEFVGSTNLLAGAVVDAAGDLTIRLDGGLTMRATGAAAVGAPVTVGVRPEKIVLSGAGANSYAGRIESQTFQGSLCHYTVRLDGGPVLSVLRQTVEGNVAQTVPSAGDVVRVSFDPKNALVFASPS